MNNNRGTHKNRSFNKSVKSGGKKYYKKTNSLSGQYSGSGDTSGRKKRFDKKDRYRHEKITRRGKYSSTPIKHSRYISKATNENMDKIHEEEAYFSAYNFHPTIQRNLEHKGYKHPTKIQYQTIPAILKGKDILGLAQTGSGKTAAFLLPMLTKTMKNKNEKCLIVCPTRELADQINAEFNSFSKNTGILSALLVGGAGYSPQIAALQKNPQFVIATPGRLIDLHQNERLNLASFNNIILDEVDHMLDMGFIRDIELIVSSLAKEKQSLFFSATMDQKSEAIANSFLKNPIRVQVEQQNASSHVEQDIIRYKKIGDKIEKLQELLVSPEADKVLIFSRTRRGADALSKELARRGFNTGALHGQKTLAQRNRAVRELKSGKISALVATDVAARGIDIPDVSHVVNYDEPANYEDYIHRIGRTGRIGKKGIALTFVRK